MSQVAVIPSQDVSNSLQPHELQHTMLPCPSLSLGVCSNSCPLSLWCHPTMSPSVFASIRKFSSELALHIRWPKYWSFSFTISPSYEYSGLISFRIDWFDLAAQGTLKSLLWHHNSNASIRWHSAFFMVRFSQTHWKTVIVLEPG